MLLCLVGIGLPVAAQTAKLPTAPEKLRIVAYNLENQAAEDAVKKAKTPEAHAAAVKIVVHLDPDIAVLCEVLGEASYLELYRKFKDAGLNFQFGTIVKGQDGDRNITVFSKIQPARVNHEVNATYSLNGQDVRVRRGFAHCVFRWQNGYELHIVGAHLKSKVFHQLGQTDMRRYEARLLRYLADDIIKANPAANILVLGDMNDLSDSSPLNTLYARRSGPQKQLYDLRPVDGQNHSWTHYWDQNDTYSRIDYALASLGILPEVAFAETVIPDIAEIELASDHRPLLVVIRPQEKPLDEGLMKLFDRNILLPRPRAATLQEGRVVGTRKARKE